MIYLALSNLIFVLIICYYIKRHLHYSYTHRTFHRLIDHINIGYYKYRPSDGIILDANNGFVKILELDMSEKEVIGRALSELIISVDGEENIKKQLKSFGEIRNYEYHFKTLEGKDKCVLHNSYVDRSLNKNDEVVEALIEDITEERLSYDKMKESEERYEKLFKNSGDMVIICKLDDCKIEEINPVTEVLTGFSEEELIGRSMEDLIHPFKRKDMEECKEDLIFKGSSRLETVFVCKNGSYKEVILTMSIVELKDEKSVLVVAKDISMIVKEKEEEKRRKSELEDFWKASIEREERIKCLRHELEIAKQQIKMLKSKHDIK